MDGRDRYCLSCWNATTHSSDHSNSFHLCSKRKKGLHLSADLDMNRFKATIIPVSFCTSLGFRGGCKLLMALIWFGFTSIPLWVTMYPKTFLSPLQKNTWTHSDATYAPSGFQKCLWDLPHAQIPPYSLQLCHQCRLQCSCPTVVRTFWSSFVDKLILHFSSQMALLCSDNFQHE